MYLLIVFGALGILSVSLFLLSIGASRHNTNCIKGLEITWEPFGISIGLAIMYVGLMNCYIITSRGSF